MSAEMTPDRWPGWVPLDEAGLPAPGSVEECDALIVELLAQAARIDATLRGETALDDVQRRHMRRVMSIKLRFVGQLKEWRGIRREATRAAEVAEARRTAVARKDAVRASAPPADRLLGEAYGMLRALQKAGAFVPDADQAEALAAMRAQVMAVFRGKPLPPATEEVPA